MTLQGEKKAVQARAQITRDKLVAALEALLKEKSFEEISVADIAKRAGVAVGTVYRRFESKDAFIPIIFDLYRARVVAFAKAPESQYQPLPEEGLFSALDRMVQLSWLFLEQDGHLLRAAHIYSRTRSDLIGRGWDELLEESAAGYLSVLRLFASEIQRPNLDDAARMTLYLLNTAIGEYGLYPAQGPGAVIKMSQEEFTHSISLALYGYLTSP